MPIRLPSCLLLMALVAMRGFGADEVQPGAGSVQGGLCVLVGAGDPALAESLVHGHPFVVHALDADAAKVVSLTKAIQGENLYGRIMVEAWPDPTLPFADNLASLVVVDGPSTIPSGELMRVLRPLGELMVRSGTSWTRTVKPWVDGMDEWTHWRHGPDGNMVSKDKIVDVPGRLQWTFGRDLVSERTFAVYSGGRFFAYEDNSVLARDAFNGMPLWRAPVKLEMSIMLRDLGYNNLDKIVADHDRVYFSSPDGVFSAHDAVTGKPVLAYAKAGTPLVVRQIRDGDGPGTLVLADLTSVRALDAATGAVLWQQEASVPMHLVADQKAAYYVTGDFLKKEPVAIIACDLKSGKVLWKHSDFTEPCPWPAQAVGCSMGYGMLAYELKPPHRWPGGWRKYYEEHPDGRKASIIVISAKDGSIVVETAPGGAAARHGEWNVAYWVDNNLLRNGLVKGQGSGLIMNPVSNLKQEVTFDDNDVGDRGFGHCFPPTITERFYIYGQLNFTDLATHAHRSNQFTRAGCGLDPGYIPANGMLYVHPKHCVCFPMLDGNAALANPYAKTPAESHPLIKGAAFGATGPATDPGRDWPVYRHDASRTGSITTEIPSQPKVLWTHPIATPVYKGDEVASEWLQHQYVPGIITQPTIAGGLVFVAQPDTHRIVALDAASGDEKWSFTANGRIDGPPTIHRGLCLFGSRSGWLFALRASDGQLAWKLRLSPYDLRISMFGQTESPTPVPGSPVIINDRLYIGAGLHPMADAGVLVFCIEPADGTVVWQQKYTSLGYEDRAGWGPKPLAENEDPWRRTGAREYEPFDLPVRDGNSVAVSRWLFDLKTGAPTLKKLSCFYEVPDSAAWMRRRTWSYGPRRIDHRTPLAVCSGSAVFTTLPSGPRIIRVDFSKGKPFDPNYLNGAAEAEKDKDKDLGEGPLPSATAKYLAMGPTWKAEGEKAGKNAKTAAMVCAGKQLFVITDTGTLETWSADTGKLVAEQRLEKAIFDGLAAADGRLYLSTASGKVICLGR
jgi:outer membrane protein assembly factor BamB